jgi:hypothetical protein
MGAGAEVVNGTPRGIDAATLAELEEYLLGLLYRLENRIMEQTAAEIATRISDGESALITQLNAALEGFDDRIAAMETRLAAMTSALSSIQAACDEMLAENDDTEEATTDDQPRARDHHGTR